jgi:hypothetical protein
MLQEVGTSGNGQELTAVLDMRGSCDFLNRNNTLNDLTEMAACNGCLLCITGERPDAMCVSCDRLRVGGRWIQTKASRQLAGGILCDSCLTPRSIQ